MRPNAYGKKWLVTAAFCREGQGCSLCVCGLLCVVTFSRLLTGLYETSYEHHAFEDASHLQFVIPGEIKHSPRFSTEVKNEWRYTSTRPYVLSWRGRG